MWAVTNHFSCLMDCRKSNFLWGNHGVQSSRKKCSTTISGNVPQHLYWTGFVAQGIILQVCLGGSRNCESVRSYFLIIFKSKFLEYLTSATWNLSATVAAHQVFISSPWWLVLVIYIYKGLTCLFAEESGFKVGNGRVQIGYFSFWRCRALTDYSHLSLGFAWSLSL